MTHNPPTTDLTAARHAYLADELGRIAARIKEMTEQKKLLESELKADHVDVVEGNLFRVSISYDVQTTRVDWKAVSAKLKPSRQLVTAHTTVGLSDRVNVRARSAAARKEV